MGVGKIDVEVVKKDCCVDLSDLQPTGIDPFEILEEKTPEDSKSLLTFRCTESFKQTFVLQIK